MAPKLSNLFLLHLPVSEISSDVLLVPEAARAPLKQAQYLEYTAYTTLKLVAAASSTAVILIPAESYLVVYNGLSSRQYLTY